MMHGFVLNKISSIHPRTRAAFAVAVLGVAQVALIIEVFFSVDVAHIHFELLRRALALPAFEPVAERVARSVITLTTCIGVSASRTESHHHERGDGTPDVDEICD